MHRVNFEAIRKAAVAHARPLLERRLPGGRYEGCEYTVRNPKRNDRNPGSFRINFKTGRWGDFAIRVTGGDLISLMAYLDDVSQVEAARRLAKELGVRDA